MKNKDINININITRIVHIIHESEFLSLYVGQNVNGKYIISSFLDEEDEKGFYLMYLHVITDNSQIDSFLRGKISYLQVLQNAKKIYRVDKNYNYEIIDSYITSFEELEKIGTIPSKDSFFITEVPQSLLLSLSKNDFYKI